MESVLICSAVFLIALAFCLAVSRHNRDAFNERFPPISDAEFLARCKPGTNPEVALKVRRIIAESLGVEYERIHPSMRFVDME